ncbi:hypothetical protein ABFS82_11G125700 [Erythranthe guttata]
MEFFNQAKTVRLKGHLDKYLIADDDETTVRQSRSAASSRKARWTVELVAGNPHVIRLKSCHGRYLTASDESYLLGMTGKKVLQTIPDSMKDTSIEWEPIKEGYQVKLRTRGCKFLRANGATPPWRNSVTHDLPHRTATQDWVMWDVDVVDISVLDDEYLPPTSNASSFSSSQFEEDVSSPNSPFSGAAAERLPESPAAARRRWTSILPDRSSHSSGRQEEISSPNSPFSSTAAASVKEAERLPESPAAARRRWPSILPDRSSHNSARQEEISNPKSPLSVKSGSPRLALSASEKLPGSPIAAKKRWPSILSDRSSLNSGTQDGMEFFERAKAVRLQSHLGKYLVADDDEETVRQSRNGASNRARWSVEFVDGKRNRIRLKSCHGLYLTATDEAFLLGMTGKKVLQTMPERKNDVAIEWEPVKEGLSLKLMTCAGKFLRGNGGAPPWRNSVTHDVPHRTATQPWVLWSVDVVDISLSDPDPDPKSDSFSPRSSFSSVMDDYSGSPDSGSPDTGSPMAMVQYSNRSGSVSMNQVSGMEFFKDAKTVRLKSHHDKYLTAESDEETVVQDRSGSSTSARWNVEFVDGVENVIRLKSRYGKYLKAADEEFLLGVTGRRVVQALPRKLDSSVEWEPVRDGMQVKLKSRYGNFLRANGGLPPWRNSITHDIPHRHRDWILWEVDIVEIRPDSPPKVVRSDSLESDLNSSSFRIPFPKRGSSGSFDDSNKKSEGRLIYYYVANDDGEINDAIEEPSFQFKGHGLEELTQKLEEETGLEDIIVCSRNIVNGKLYPLRLALPPNNATMHVVVVPPTSKAANEFLPP